MATACRVAAAAVGRRLAEAGHTTESTAAAESVVVWRHWMDQRRVARMSAGPDAAIRVVYRECLGLPRA